MGDSIIGLFLANIMGSPLKTFRKKEMPKNILSDVLFIEEKEEKRKLKLYFLEVCNYFLPIFHSYFGKQRFELSHYQKYRAHTLVY